MKYREPSREEVDIAHSRPADDVSLVQGNWVSRYWKLSEKEYLQVDSNEQVVKERENRLNMFFVVNGNLSI